mmetsp:Transcript_106337/g.179552  ORF Transcript_106337/g.179552 Transcript_106337/m.179552 type:complete len:83 (-) Transcript_106337:576-824(-)
MFSGNTDSAHYCQQTNHRRERNPPSASSPPLQPPTTQMVVQHASNATSCANSTMLQTNAQTAFLRAWDHLPTISLRVYEGFG